MLRTITWFEPARCLSSGFECLFRISLHCVSRARTHIHHVARPAVVFTVAAVMGGVAHVWQIWLVKRLSVREIHDCYWLKVWLGSVSHEGCGVSCERKKKKNLVCLIKQTVHVRLNGALMHMYIFHITSRTGCLFSEQYSNIWILYSPTAVGKVFIFSRCPVSRTRYRKHARKKWKTLM